MEDYLNQAVFGSSNNATTISRSTAMTNESATLSPTMAPSFMFVGDADSWFDNPALWVTVWVTALVLFLFCPFCITKSRRDLCWRRIKERRWIADDTEDDWYVAAIRRQQEQRRQRLEEEQRQFEISRTQEDEIREQFLLQCMSPFTMTLASEDIHELEESTRGSLKRSGSFCSRGSHGSRGSTRKSLSKKGALPVTEDMHDSDTVLESIDLESQMVVTIPNNNNSNTATEVKEERSNSLTSEEEEEQVLAFDFDDCHQKIYVPLPGQTVAQTAEKQGASSSKRLVSSGCAICLCLFDPDEKITWSANPGCQHIFHSDCVLHWFLAVGRKTQRRRLRHNPDMSPDEAISKICEFPMSCPCCRQEFCREVGAVEDAPSTATTRSTDEMDSEEMEAPESNNQTTTEENGMSHADNPNSTDPEAQS